MAGSQKSRKRRCSDATEPVAKQAHIELQGEPQLSGRSGVSSPLTPASENVDEIVSHDDSVAANQSIQALVANIAPSLPAKEYVHEAAATSHDDPGGLDLSQVAFANGQSQAPQNDNVTVPVSTATSNLSHGLVSISEGTTSPDFEAYYKHVDRIQALSLLETIVSSTYSIADFPPQLTGLFSILGGSSGRCSCAKLVPGRAYVFFSDRIVSRPNLQSVGGKVQRGQEPLRDYWKPIHGCVRRTQRLA